MSADSEYQPKELAAMTDEQLLDETASRIHGAAVMNGSQWADQYHRDCDEAYDECKKRARGIYQRAFNSVARSQGHHQMVSQPEEGTP